MAEAAEATEGVEDVTKDELAQLLPSERAALLGEDDADDDPPAESKDEKAEAAAAEPEETAEETEEEGEDAGATDEGTVETEAAPEPAAPEASASDDDDDDEVPAFRFVADAEYKSARDAIIAEFEDHDGTMTFAQCQDKLEELRTATEAKQHDAWLWQKSVHTFMRENPQFRESNKLLNSALDSALKSLASDAANNNKSAKWFLNTAKANVLAEIKQLTGADVGGAKKPAATAKPRPKAPPVEKLPKTLAGLPDAEPGDAGEAEDWMAELDRLADKSPLGYEQALAKLSPARQKAYLEGK